eukprot:PITA_07419
MQQVQAKLEALIAGRNIDDGDVSEPEDEAEGDEEAVEVTPEMRFFQLVLRSSARPKTEVSIYEAGLNPKELIDWINGMEKFFDYEETKDEKKVNLVVSKLKGHATVWWDGVQAERKRLGKKPIKNWSRMVTNLRVKEYIEEFYKVSIRAGQTQDTDEMVARYVNGLRMDIQDEISTLSPKTVEEAYQMVLKAEENLMRKKSTRGRVEGEAPATGVVEEENIPERGEPFLINKVFLRPANDIVEPSQRKTLFRTVCKAQGKCCQMIIHSGSTNNLVSIEVVEKLKLKTTKHPTPYKVSWLQKGDQMLVNEQCEVELQLGKNRDKIVCDVMPMDVCHILLGRPWQYNRGSMHDGKINTYKFGKDGINHTLLPMEEEDASGKKTDPNSLIGRKGILVADLRE